MASRVGVLGWVTGVLSAVLGALAFGAVLCLWFPAVLTTPALRDVYPMEIVRTTIKIALGVAFVLIVVGVIAVLSRSSPRPITPPDPYAAKVDLSDVKMSAAENFVGARITYIEGIQKQP